MRFVYDLTVSANTLKAAPVETKINLIPGTLTGAFIRFKRGPHFLVKVAVYESLFQIIPVSGSDELYGDGEIISIPMDYELTGISPELILAGWSPGTDYSHTVTFWFDITPKEKSLNLLALQNLIGFLKGR